MKLQGSYQMREISVVRPSPSHAVDDLDSDFFDQLANEFGSGDLGSLPSDLHQDERDRLDDAFSKLILGDEDCAPIISSTTDALPSSSTKEEGDQKTSIELSSWLKDDNAEETSVVTKASNSSDEGLLTIPYPSVESSSKVDECVEASDILDGSVNLHTQSNNDTENQPLITEVSSCRVLANSIAVAEVSQERLVGNCTEPSGLKDAYERNLITSSASCENCESSLISANKETSCPTHVQNTLTVIADDHSQPEASAMKLIDAFIDQTPVNNCTAQSLKKLDAGEDIGLPGVKELQWSCFGNSCIPDAFGSSSDFFLELGNESLVGLNQQITAPIGGYQTETSMGPLVALNSQGSFEESFSVQAGASIYNSSLEHFDERASWNQHDIHDIGVREQDKLRSTSFVTSLSEMQGNNGSEQSGIINEIFSEVGSVNDVSRTANYEAQRQEEAQLSWENMYPGWYFDYACNEWKQIEGWSIEQTENAPRDEGDLNFAQPCDSYQSITMASNSIWQSNQGQNFWPNQASDHRFNNGTYAVNDDKLAASATLPEHPANWEQQYPGWCFDYNIQQWCPSSDNSQHSVSNQGPKLMEASESVELVQNLQSSGLGWMDQEGRPHYENGVNYGIYAPEGSQTFIGSSESHDMKTLGRGMSFKSWAESKADGFGYSGQGVDNFTMGGSVGPWAGFQGADGNTSYQSYQAVTGSVNQFQQDPTLTDKQSVVGSLHASFQPQPTGSVGQERLSAGRPAHALVAFGFGGKLVTMKASHLRNTEPFVLQDLSHLVAHAESQTDASLYFSALTRLGLSGPLQGCSIKDVIRWVDERIETCENEYCQRTNFEGVRVLWGILKIACQHYGKLRSVAGSAVIKSQVEEGPEVALGRLLNTMKGRSHGNQGLATCTDVSHSLPAGHQLQAAVNQVRDQLMDGKIKEALQIAQQGQLWGLALVLAWQLGEKVYADTVLQMAQKQFSPGSPMRTLLLLFAGQASELFKVQIFSSSAGSHGSSNINAFNSQDSAGGMLSDWLGNLSIIAANPTKGDEQVIIHLGDSLWKDQGEVAGAHTCYLVADTTLEPFSEAARLCLVGADHFKFQRTFATPQAIQRTEVYEYAKTLGNPQYVLVPFLPYKLLYAHMLAEAGRINEASRYCQMVSKNLKSAGRGSEIEFCKQSVVALEERLRLHTQGGYSLNFSTGKLVGKVMGTIDSTIHKIIGGPPPLPHQATPFFGSPQEGHAKGSNVGSATKPTSIMPSASNNSLSSVNTQVVVPARSVSEPNLISSSIQNKPNAESGSVTSSASSQMKSSGTIGGGYLGRFGSQIFAKAVGLMRHSKEAKLGDENKFYYDDKLKRWVEAGAEQSTEEAVLAPPPIMAGFSSSSRSPSDVKCGGESRGPSADVTLASDLPPIPPSMNQFSARGHLQGVRSRYVDTFNKGNVQVANGPSPSPVVPAGGWAVSGSPSQFFSSPSFTAAANGSWDGRASGQNDDGSVDLQMPASDNAKSNYMLVENESLLPKNLNSSFMDVPVFKKHSSTGNIASDPSQVKGDSLPLGSMSGSVSWSGEAPTVLHQHNLSNGSMADGQTKTSPPQILEPPSHTGYGSAQMQTVTAEGMFSGSLLGAAFGEMREVEL